MDEAKRKKKHYKPMKRMSIEEIKALLHENLRAENLSLCRDGGSDIYYSGCRDGKIEAYSKILRDLDPTYDLLNDYPLQCEAPGCEEWFFQEMRGGYKKVRGKRYHSNKCGAMMRSRSYRARRRKERQA